MAKCDEIQDELSAYLDGEVQPDERAALAAHLRDCAACQAVLAKLEMVKAALAGLPHLKAPPTLSSKIYQADAHAARTDAGQAASAPATTGKIVFVHRGPFWKPALASLAALVLLSILLFQVLPRILERPSGTVALGKDHPAPTQVQPSTQSLQKEDLPKQSVLTAPQTDTILERPAKKPANRSEAGKSDATRALPRPTPPAAAAPAPAAKANEPEAPASPPAVLGAAPGRARASAKQVAEQAVDERKNLAGADAKRQLRAENTVADAAAQEGLNDKGQPQAPGMSPAAGAPGRGMADKAFAAQGAAPGMGGGGGGNPRPDAGVNEYAKARAAEIAPPQTAQDTSKGGAVAVNAVPSSPPAPTAAAAAFGGKKREPALSELVVWRTNEPAQAVKKIKDMVEAAGLRLTLAEGRLGESLYKAAKAENLETITKREENEQADKELKNNVDAFKKNAVETSTLYVVRVGSQQYAEVLKQIRDLQASSFDSDRMQNRAAAAKAPAKPAALALSVEKKDNATAEEPTVANVPRETAAAKNPVKAEAGEAAGAAAAPEIEKDLKGAASSGEAVIYIRIDADD